MGILSKLFNKNNQKTNFSYVEELEKTPGNIEINSSEILKITGDGILDTTSLENIEKFKSNLRVLINRAKEKGKIDKFMIIRDDDFFPYDWKWRVSSEDTGFEKTDNIFSYELIKEYALRQSGIVENINNIAIPISEDKIEEAISKIDKNIAKINLPVTFRSTKHFTVNTPLEVTGNYNIVDANRNFTIIDSIENFINSGYGYSVSYRDAYLDVTHEDLDISNEAIVLIEKNKYQDIIKNPIIANQLKERKVIVYIGDEYLAIDMVLSELGVLPSQVGLKYAMYDEEINRILEESIKSLAINNNLLYDKSHGGTNGHFTSYYDYKDIDNKMSNFVQFLKSKFIKYSDLITEKNIENKDYCKKIINTIGIENLLFAIQEYNNIIEQQFYTKLENYKVEKENITPEISSIFKLTVKLISEYYKNIENNSYSLDVQEQIEENICHFFHENTVQEQLEYSKRLWKILGNTVKSEEDQQDLTVEENEFHR